MLRTFSLPEFQIAALVAEGKLRGTNASAVLREILGSHYGMSNTTLPGKKVAPDASSSDLEASTGQGSTPLQSDSPDSQTQPTHSGSDLQA
jgi:hypothetical protein